MSKVNYFFISLMILVFSISCSSSEEPTTDIKDQILGNWVYDTKNGFVNYKFNEDMSFVKNTLTIVPYKTDNICGTFIIKDNNVNISFSDTRESDTSLLYSENALQIGDVVFEKADDDWQGYSIDKCIELVKGEWLKIAFIINDIQYITKGTIEKKDNYTVFNSTDGNINIEIITPTELVSGVYSCKLLNNKWKINLTINNKTYTSIYNIDLSDEYYCRVTTKNNKDGSYNGTLKSVLLTDSTATDSIELKDGMMTFRYSNF